MAIDIASATKDAVQAAVNAAAVTKVQNGVDQHLSPVSGAMKTWIQDLQKLEDKDAAFKEKVRNSNPAVQSLVDYQVKADNGESAMASGSDLQAALGRQDPDDPLTDDMTRLAENINKKESQDPWITKDMQAKYPEAQAAVDKMNNLPKAMMAGARLKDAFDAQGANQLLTPEVRTLIDEITNREAKDPSITAEMRAKYPGVQNAVDSVNNKPNALKSGSQLQAALEKQDDGAPLTDEMKHWAEDVQRREAFDHSIRDELVQKSPKAQAIVDKMSSKSSAITAGSELQAALDKGHGAPLTDDMKQLARDIKAREDEDPSITKEIRSQFPDVQLVVDNFKIKP